MRTSAQVAAQVAVEAIANEPTGYDPATIVAVRANGVLHGVADLYLDMLPRVGSCPNCGLSRHILTDDGTMCVSCEVKVG